mmetsp:Transcript_61712/g.127487  ORF Transcript_61712/g.127487 Transcript_61712/m.127487 type:complete len:533 (-) Transcript_61712:43-1641(-)
MQAGEHVYAPPLETLFEFAEDDPQQIRRRRMWRSARKAAFASRVVHHKRYPGCLFKYRTQDASEEFRYHGRFDLAAWHQGIADAEFRRFYRLSKPAFSHLVGLLSPYLDITFTARGRFSSIAQAKRSNGKGVRRVTTEMKVSMGLRWLAGGSYLDISAHHGVSSTTFFRAKDEFVAAVNACPSLEIRFPDLGDPDKLRKLAEGFERLSVNGLFKDCVGAIDGVLIHLHSVSASDSPTPTKFFTRKGCLAWNVQAVVDAQRRFTFYSIRCPGSVHDAVAFSHSDLYYQLETAGIAGNYHFIGDAAYGGMVAVATPFTWCGNMKQEHSAFNYHLSSLRIEVECAFGILLQRWGILWKGLRMPLRASTKVISACMRLHNLAIDFRDTEAPPVDMEFPGALNDVQVQGYACRHGDGCQRQACVNASHRAHAADAPRLNSRGAPSDRLWHAPESAGDVRAANSVAQRAQGPAGDSGTGSVNGRGAPRQQRNRDLGRDIRNEIVEAVTKLGLKRPKVKWFGTRQTAKVMQQAFNMFRM